MIPHNLSVHPTGIPLRFTPAGDFIVSPTIRDIKQ